MSRKLLLVNDARHRRVGCCPWNARRSRRRTVDLSLAEGDLVAGARTYRSVSQTEPTTTSPEGLPRYTSQDVCPYNVKFSEALSPDSPYAARDASAGAGSSRRVGLPADARSTR